MYLKESSYFVQDVDVQDLIQQYGDPLYVYDTEVIERQVNRLKNAFASVDLKIKYACKANTNLSILKLMLNWGVDIDVVSVEEMKLALLAGFPPERITYTSSGVLFDEVVDCVRSGILVNIDNLSTLEKFAQKYGSSKPVLVRIRPNVEGGGNMKISTGHKDSKFGIAIEQEDQLLDMIKKYDLNVYGVHQHTGSDIKDAETFTQAAEIIFELAKKIKTLRVLDFGGGFKVPYKPKDHEIDVEDLGKKLCHKFLQFQEEYGQKLELWIEPGKFLVSESGVLLTRVNVVKPNPNSIILGLNTGLNHLIRPMMYGAYHSIVNVSKPSDILSNSYHVVGYMCETDDIAKDRLLPETKEGDIIAILNAGAYGFSMSSNYNSRLRPSEVLIYKGRDYLIRKREVFDDLIKNQIIADF